MAQCPVDAILITCTNYIAILQEEQLSSEVPIIKMDEPYFERICQVTEPQIILFTNPATVKGTMDRLYQYAHNHQKSLDVEVRIINNTFELLMQGLKEEYNQAISQFLNQIIKKENKLISVAQLSMVAASQQVAHKTSTHIMNPLQALRTSIVNQLKLDKKS